MNTLTKKNILITGGSRGIGRAMALAFARQHANIAVCAKTDTPHPTLKGTIHSVAEEIQALGGTALPIKLDVREDFQIKHAVETVVETFGGIDILINNASAIFLANTLETPMKRFDLMMAVNVRATFAMSQACIPYLKKSENPHILNLSPPFNMDPKWFAPHLAYTISKYGMSTCTLGMAAELKQDGIAVNSLWPHTTIATAAIEVNFPKELIAASRTPDIMADAALQIVTKNSRDCTGHFFIDEMVLRDAGITDFDRYAVSFGTPLHLDLYLDE